MKYRKVRYSYLIYSLIIHIVLLICVAWIYVKNEPPFQDQRGFNIDVYNLPRSNIVQPLETTTTKTEPTVEEIDHEKPPTPSKPTVDLKSEQFVNVNRDDSDTAKPTRTTKAGRKDPDRVTIQSNSERSHERFSDTQNIRSTPQDVNQDVFAFSPSTETDDESVLVDTNKIQFDTKNALNTTSPSVNAPNIQYGSKRGDALRATSMSNTWRNSGSSGRTNLIGIYPKLMKTIAEKLRMTTTSDKVDIVLILDETASMVDNISGIRAYFDTISDTLARDHRDAHYGLITFTDKTKAYKLTDDIGKFKNWLYKIDVDHGGDISEAGLDALMTAVDKIKFRKNAQRFFILASDAAFHDADYDGKSRYSLDEVIANLQKEKIRVEVIGLDYLPIKQIALATGGTWHAIPGKGYLEYVPKITLTMKMLSGLGTLSIDGSDDGDKIIVYVNNPPRPKKLKLTWKVLNPLGEKCYGPYTKTTEIPDDDTTNIEITPELNTSKFQTITGTYTVIYRLENDLGHKSILRKTIEYHQ